MKPKLRKPTFEMLFEKRRLAVINPENGLRFVISLRDWVRLLWAVRVVPHDRHHCRDDSFVTAHRILDRSTIEDGWSDWCWTRSHNAG